MPNEDDVLSRITWYRDMRRTKQLLRRRLMFLAALYVITVAVTLAFF